MCGIAGMVHKDPRYPLDSAVLEEMRDAITHRGPDDAGSYCAGGVGLASRRLAVLDLSERGHMPMHTPDGRYWIVYNGEVYNHLDLRPELEAKGWRFRSHSDTETLLYLYAEFGPAMLDRLNGMFGIAIWDTQERSLFLARDRMGVKPVYYVQHQDILYFASEQKALFAATGTPSFDHSTWEELLCFRYVAGEQTPFEGVHRLLAGHYLIWRNGHIETKRWWHYADRVQALRETMPRSEAETEEWFRQHFDDAVRVRRLSDVPIGVLLSGGLDSSSVAASLAQQDNKQIASFTVRFTESGYDEGPLAKKVADANHLEYHELFVPPDHLLTHLQEASWLNDEPLSHANALQLLAISRYAKPRVTVLLSGEGGDETLGGYQRYRPLRHYSLLQAGSGLLKGAVNLFNLQGRPRKLSQFLEMGSLDRFLLFNSCDVLPAQLQALGSQSAFRFSFREKKLLEAKSLYPDDPWRQAMYGDQQAFLCSVLDRNDRMTMGASIECRVPFLDYRLVEGLAALPSSLLISGRKNKPLLRNALGSRLPQEILNHRKWGFGVPWHSYLRTVPELREMVSGLPDSEPLRSGPFDRAKLRVLVQEFFASPDAHNALVLQLLMIVVWHQVYWKKASRFRSPERIQA